MTQDKAPEWAMKEAGSMMEALGFHAEGEGSVMLALALSQAYERGQVDMRERAAEAARRHLEVCQQVAARANLLGSGAEFYGGSKFEVPSAIRSLPIEQGRKP